ncbi:hypothetical protein GY654_03130 [Vibrio parahaemolyticus]|nr:hypothetical protein [Vibrio parahaemolyticus]
MRMITIKKGLDIPIAGTPTQAIHDAMPSLKSPCLAKNMLVCVLQCILA